MQKVLTFYTQTDDMRAEADGWGAEDGTNAVSKLDKEVGLISGMHTWCPTTPLHALGAGWKLLAPPIKLVNDPYFQYKWWFVQ